MAAPVPPNRNKLGSAPPKPLAQVPPVQLLAGYGDAGLTLPNPMDAQHVYDVVQLLAANLIKLQRQVAQLAQSQGVELATTPEEKAAAFRKQAQATLAAKVKAMEAEAQAELDAQLEELGAVAGDDTPLDASEPGEADPFGALQGKPKGA